MEIMHWRYTGTRILQNISSVLSLELERRKCIMSEMMKAPRINHWINVLRGGKMVFNKETNETIDRVFEQLHLIAPCGDDERREIWLKAERGSAEDYDDYEYLKEEEIVDTYEDFLRMWQEEYPDEVNWFHLVTIERDDYRAIFLGRELIYQSRVYEEHEVYEYGLKELFVWMEEAVKKCVEDLQNGLVGDIRKFAVVTDNTVKDLYVQKLNSLLQNNGYVANIISFPAGEKSKTRATKEYVEDTMLELGYRRDCCMLL